MPTYSAPTKDMQFILHDLLNISQSNIPGYDELEADFTSLHGEMVQLSAINEEL